MASVMGNSWRLPSGKSSATSAAGSGSTRGDKSKHGGVPVRDCPEQWPCKALYHVPEPLWKITTKVLCLHNRHSLAGTKISSLVYLPNDVFLVYSLWGGDDGFAGRAGQLLSCPLEVCKITADWLVVSVFAVGGHLKWQRWLNAENVFS